MYVALGGLCGCVGWGGGWNRSRTDSLCVNQQLQQDDSYCIRYAQAHGGCVVTNDQYRDQLSKLDERGTDKEEREALRKWLKGHLISFTFVGDEFIPNPDFRFG